ncbi:hypothetical protein VTH06DRAFT_1968 [Thermothelomyces fergusii]
MQRRVGRVRVLLNPVLRSNLLRRKTADEEEDPSDLFAVPDLWRPSAWLDFSADGSNANPLFSLQTETGEPGVTSIENPEAEPEPSTSQDGNEEEEEEKEEEEDFWLFHDEDAAKPRVLRTWESFEQPEQEDGGPPFFISEAGPAAFDALLASRQDAGDVPNILDAGTYCACLLNLALGRSSVLFSWDSGGGSFVKTAPFLRISGLSLDLVKAVDGLCLECGNSARHLQSFSEETYSAASTPTRIALAGVVGRLVAAVRSELSKNSHAVRSVLQLQSVVRPAQSVLSYFSGLVKKLARQESDEALLSSLFEEVQACEYRDVLLREATREVLRIVSKPWTDLVEEWIGLRPEGDSIGKLGSGKGFVRVADGMWIDDQAVELEEADYVFDRDRMPAFIPEDMAQSIFEAGRNLRFLREHHPEHPLARPDVVSLASPPPLKWELTHALFDPDLSTAERRSGVALGGGTMGLRLGGRKTWPPASSELRLALMGVLSECYEPTTTTTSRSSSASIAASIAASGRGGSPNLPGDLSFAVRDLSPQEIDRCMDPHSLEALDFLRLSYKPPRALRPVITPAILSKYDRIFKLLLRVLRMLYVAVYFFDVGIGVPWARFGSWLDAVQAYVQAEPETAQTLLLLPSFSSATAVVASPDVLRERQERVLDEIMAALFLRKRQAPVMVLLEEAFGVVLRFARASGDARWRQRRKRKKREGEREGEGEETAGELYRLFRKKVEAFITVCRGLGEKMAVSNAAAAAAAPAGVSFGRGLGPETGRGGGDGVSVEQLLLRLDMAGFYGRDVGWR